MKVDEERLTMRRLRIAVFSLLAVVLLAACDAGWVEPLGGPDHASFNPGENVLTLANVTTLQQAFHATVSPITGGSGGFDGTPVVKFGVLVVVSGNTVTAFDGTTGAQKWQQTLPGQINGGPFIDGTTVLVSYPGFEQGLDLFSGAEDTPVAISGMLVAVRGDNSLSISYTSSIGGDYLGWAQISGKPLSGELAGIGLATTFGPKYLYFDTPTGISSQGVSSEGIVAYDPDQACGSVCTPVWTQNVGGILDTPALGPDSTLYVGRAGRGGLGVSSFGLTALDGNTGSVKWSNTSLPLYGTPAVANGVVYSQSDTTFSPSGFAALSAADGHTLWTSTTLVQNPTVAGGVVYGIGYGTAGAEVVAYNANGCGQATCAPIWTGSLGTDGASGGLAVTGGVLYVGTTTGVTAFKPTS